MRLVVHRLTALRSVSDAVSVELGGAAADEVRRAVRGVIERAVKLWSNPGDLICSPFAGIGSEGVGALRLKRRFVGCELKRSYWKSACDNLRRAEFEAKQPTLFDLAAV